MTKPVGGIFLFDIFLSFSTAPSSPHSPADDPPDRGFFIRMKSTLTKRGLHVKSSGYKVQSLIKLGKTCLVLFVISYLPACPWKNQITRRLLSFCFALPGFHSTVKLVVFSVFYGTDLISYSESDFVLCLS